MHVMCIFSCLTYACHAGNAERHAPHPFRYINRTVGMLRSRYASQDSHFYVISDEEAEDWCVHALVHAVQIDVRTCARAGRHGSRWRSAVGSTAWQVDDPTIICALLRACVCRRLCPGHASYDLSKLSRFEQAMLRKLDAHRQPNASDRGCYRRPYYMYNLPHTAQRFAVQQLFEGVDDATVSWHPARTQHMST